MNMIKKQVKDLNRQLTKEDIKIKNKHMKRCSTSHVIRETYFFKKRYPLHTYYNNQNPELTTPNVSNRNAHS